MLRRLALALAVSPALARAEPDRVRLGLGWGAVRVSLAAVGALVHALGAGEAHRRSVPIGYG